MTSSESPAAGPVDFFTVWSRARHLPLALGVSGVLLVLAAGVGWAYAGVTAALGAAAGVGSVSVGYALTHLMVAWADVVYRRLVLPVGLVAYSVKLVLYGCLLTLVAQTGWTGLQPMLYGMASALLVWMVTQAIWTWRTPISYVDLEAGEPSSPRSGMSAESR